MPPWPEGRQLALAEIVTNVRRELTEARAEADQDELRFDVAEASLEIDLPGPSEPPEVVPTGAPAAAADGPRAARGARLTVRLTLRPEAAPDDEEPGAGVMRLPRPEPQEVDG